MPTTFLRLPDVMRRTGLKRSSIYLRIAAGTFPPQINSVRTACWIESEIQDWIEDQIKQSRSPEGAAVRQRRSEEIWRNKLGRGVRQKAVRKVKQVAERVP